MKAEKSIAALKKYIPIVLFLVFSLVSYFAGFNPGIAIFSSFGNLFIEMITFLPFLFVLVGLFDVWVPKEKIQKHIGKDSGIRGTLIVILLAMLQAGPLYGAFPVAYILRKKGASVMNVFVYIGAFTSLKIPMLGLEIGYLGAKFTLIRTLVSIPIFILIGALMQKILGDGYEVNSPGEREASK